MLDCLLETTSSLVDAIFRQMLFTKREYHLRCDRRWQQLLTVVGVALFFAIISPYNAVTYLSFPVRWLYWVVTIGTSWLMSMMCFAYLVPRRIAPGVAIAVGSLAAMPAIFVIIYLVQIVIGFPVDPSFIPTLLASIWLICIAVSWLYFVVSLGESKAQPVEVRGVESGVPPLNRQLPATFRDAEIVAIQADDHYVQIHTNKGVHMHYMRLRDAIELMSGTPGVRVHRSWWVNESAISRVRREGGNWRLDTEYASDISVSRSGLAQLKALGHI